MSDIRRQKKRCSNQCSNDCYILCGCLHTVYTILPPSYFASRSLFPPERGSVSVVSCSKNIRKPYRLPSSIECRALSMTGLAIWQTVSVWKLLDFSLLFIARYTAMVCLSSLTRPHRLGWWVLEWKEKTRPLAIWRAKRTYVARDELVEVLYNLRSNAHAWHVDIEVCDFRHFPGKNLI